MIVFLHVFQQFGDVLELVFVEDEVEDFRSHVLWRGHRELSQVVEDEGTAIVY